MTITAGLHTKGEANNAPSVDGSSLNTQPTGSLFVAANVGQGTVSVHDNEANTWLTGAAQSFNGGNGLSKFLYAQNALGGTGNIITGTQTGGAGPLFLFGEFLGCALSGGPNQSNFTELFGATAAVACPAVTPTVDGCLIVTVLVGANGDLVTPASLNGTVTDAFLLNGLGVGGAMSWFVAGVHGVPYSDTLTFAGQTSYDFAAYTFAFQPLAVSTFPPVPAIGLIDQRNNPISRM